MTSFFNWRELTYNLPSDRPIHLQRSVAVNSQQAVYALTWSNVGPGFRSLTSAPALDSKSKSNPPPDRRKLAPWAGLTLRVHRVPFKALVGPRPAPLRHPPNTMKKTRSSILEDENVKTPPEVHSEHEILEYSCSKHPNVPPLDRQSMIQATTIVSESETEVMLLVLTGCKAYLFNTRLREWHSPIEVSPDPLLLKQFISLRDSQMFIQYQSRGGWPQFAVLDVAKRSVRNPVRIPALPRSHGLTFFVAEHTNTLNAIVDRWPTCSRDWWSLKLDSILIGDQPSSVLECTHINTGSIELHYSDFVPVGNRWIIGLDGRNWQYHEENDLIPNQDNDVDDRHKISDDLLTVIDKWNGQVLKIKAIPERPNNNELLAATCSPGFYIPIQLTDRVTLEAPAMLYQATGRLVLRLWGSSSSRLPPDIDTIWEYLSLLKIDDSVVARILSFILL